MRCVVDHGMGVTGTFEPRALNVRKCNPYCRAGIRFLKHYMGWRQMSIPELFLAFPYEMPRIEFQMEINLIDAKTNGSRTHLKAQV